MKDVQSIFSNIEREQLARDFNKKPKDAITKIKSACTEKGIQDVEREIAKFLKAEAKNLNLKFVGDYISDAQNSKVLEEFSNLIDLSGKSFVEALRFYLEQFKLPGESQQIDRIVEKFAEAYIKGNPEAAISSKDAAYKLAFQTIMLNTDLHNPAIKNRMTPEQLKRNLRGTNNGANFDDKLLDNLYKEIQKAPFKLNFMQIPQGIEIKNKMLKGDKTFNKLLSMNGSISGEKIGEIFPTLKDEVNIQVTVNTVKPITKGDKTKPSPTMSVTVKGGSPESSAIIDIFIPNVFSRKLLGNKPSVTIRPSSGSSLDLCSKIAASFKTPITTFKGTYDYEVKELIDSFNKAMTTVKSSNVQADKSTERPKPSVRPTLQRKDTEYGILKGNDDIELPNKPVASAWQKANPTLSGERTFADKGVGNKNQQQARSEEIKKGLAERNRPKLERKERSTIEDVQEKIWESKISNLGKKRDTIQEPVKKPTMLDKFKKVFTKNKTDGGSRVR